MNASAFLSSVNNRLISQEATNNKLREVLNVLTPEVPAKTESAEHSDVVLAKLTHLQQMEHLDSRLQLATTTTLALTETLAKALGVEEHVTQQQ